MNEFFSRKTIGTALIWFLIAYGGLMTAINCYRVYTGTNWSIGIGGEICMLAHDRRR